MYKLSYTEQAKSDLVAIQRYIIQTSGLPKTGYNFTKKLRNKCKELASIKGIIGRERPEIMKGIRSHPVESYVIFFRYTEDTFEVITIIEGHKDIISHFEMN
ncbi:MAG: type II toxin-antitoxin system RelE/ParE family toxin [Alphaproteobacteria bacterium]|nr:type II toxin-antitoxin system RelE/ParE family toxin [Alphaproteobacteria bacterium]